MKRYLRTLLSLFLVFSLLTQIIPCSIRAEGEETGETEEYNTEVLPEETVQEETEEPFSDVLSAEEIRVMNEELLRSGADIDAISKDPDAPTGVTVRADRSKIRITMNHVGNSGMFKLYRMDANEYYEGDPHSGLSMKIHETGTYLGTYLCAEANAIEFNRYRSDGTDNLYSKYYLIQNDVIYAGPYYATNVESYRSVPRFDVPTKKGLTHEGVSTYAIAQDMGIGNTYINLDLGTMIHRKEDENGNPVDVEARGGIPFECNGETFYFDYPYISSIDYQISEYSRMGINVSLIVIAWAKTDLNSYPSSLLYTRDNRWTMAFNTSNDRGLDYFIAAMEFLGERYSRNSDIGLVNKFIIGNEIDYTYDWSLIMPLKSVDENGVTHYNRADFDVFMEEYARGLRMADLAVKKYNSEAKVMMSFTHNWAKSHADVYIPELVDTDNMQYNSYAPKDCLDWMNTVEKARGDYNWGVGFHPYPIYTYSSIPNYTDLHQHERVSDTERPNLSINGDWRTSPYITCVNLELYQQYFEQPVNRYNGTEIREITLSEAAVCSHAIDPTEPGFIGHYQFDGQTREETAKILKYRHAATVAQYYYRAANLPCISEMVYFQPHDQSSLKLGLMDLEDNKKPAYNVYKYADTELSYTYSLQYLPWLYMYEPGGYPEGTDYYDFIDIVHSGYWERISRETFDRNVMTRTIEETDISRSLIVEKTNYLSDEAILVQAFGTAGDIVALYKAGEDLEDSKPIYSYPVEAYKNRIRYYSGKICDLPAHGDIDPERKEDAVLKAGNYRIVLLTNGSLEAASKDIVLSEDYTIGARKQNLRTDQDSYHVGEDILVTASSGNNGGWVGLYRKGEVPGIDSSIYWYYLEDENSGQLYNEPAVLQSKSHNYSSSNPQHVLEAGVYTLYLFGDSGYTNILAKKDLVVEGARDIPALLSLDYHLYDEHDGYANGMVTVTKSSDNVSATDCIMYWADESGKPLEGYTSLAMFKLNGDVTQFPMYSHTIIPEGAKKLIAYASDGVSLSQEYVSYDLPEDCSYLLQEEPLTEMQIVSDIHVHKGQGHSDEQTYSSEHFTAMLKDIKKNSPDSIGIFINGDIADTGAYEDFEEVYRLYLNEKLSGGSLPDMHIEMGNHDWMKGNPNRQFQYWANRYNDNISSDPKEVYYDETYKGYHFIYAAGEEPGANATLSREQLLWLDKRLSEIEAEGEDKPVFLFLHQSFYNTVAGSLPGQGWNGVNNEEALKSILRKYDNILLFNGHSHWELNAESCLYPGDELLPAAFNTASVSYLWTSYNVLGGEYGRGSHGWYVEIYPDKYVLLGRDFENGLWIPSALFVVERNKVTGAQDSYEISMSDEAVNLDLKAEDEGTCVTYQSLDDSILSVTEDGTLIPKKSGVARIVATASAGDTTIISRKIIEVAVIGGSVTRLSGKTRYETSLETAKELKKVLGVDRFDAVVVSTGANFADALAGGYLAAKVKAPILLTSTGKKDAVNRYIRENLSDDGTIYVLGGTGAVPEECLEGLENYEHIIRLSGKNRYETNLAILEEAGVEDEDILVCTGTNFADSLAASAAGRPILLVGQSLNQAQRSFLEAHSANDLYIIGGSGAVSEQIEEELSGYHHPVRLSGKNRYETSVLIARAFFEHPEKAVLAYSHNFPDGLCGGPLAYFEQAPIILTQTEKESKAMEYAYRENIDQGYILGGSRWISGSCAALVFRCDPNMED